MSWLSNAVGKIPLVGHGLNQIGKVLPSGGQIAGGLALGPLGSVIGGAVDGNTTPLQKNIGNTVAAAGGALGLGGLAAGAGTGGLGGLVDAAKKVGGGLGLGSLGGGNLVDMGLGGAAALQAAKLQGQSNDYAHNALDTANQSYNARAPLRLAGVEGMLHPEAGNATKLAGVRANTGVGNPFAKKPLPLTGVA